MKFEVNRLYHIYNRGNNRQQIFFDSENQIYFLHKVRKYILPHCEILAYCLMPNHFHFLVWVDERILTKTHATTISKNVLSEGFRNLLSSYTQAINKKHNWTGSLFTQNTKAKALALTPDGFICLKYIHQNPLKAELVTKMEDWVFSSYQDYSGLRNGSLCNGTLANDILQFDKVQFFKTAYEQISEQDAKRIF